VQVHAIYEAVGNPIDVAASHIMLAGIYQADGASQPQLADDDAAERHFAEAEKAVSDSLSAHAEYLGNMPLLHLSIADCCARGAQPKLLHLERGLQALRAAQAALDAASDRALEGVRMPRDEATAKVTQRIAKIEGQIDRCKKAELAAAKGR
jgi:hypothetical protein